MATSSSFSSSSSSEAAAVAARLWRSRWLVLVASSWLQACAGVGYAFGSFSPLLKRSLGYNQQKITILGNAKDIGDAIGLISGSLCDVLPAWGIILIGALENLLGYGWLWLIVTQRASAMPFWAVSLFSIGILLFLFFLAIANLSELPRNAQLSSQLVSVSFAQICALIFIGTNGETYFNTATLVTNVRNFPKSRGQVVGLLKGYTGLCGAIFAQIYTTFFAPDEASYILIIALGPTIVAFFLMFVIRPLKAKTSPESAGSDSTRFRFIYGHSVVLAAYLMGVLILQDLRTFSSIVSLVVTIVLFFLLALPLATPLLSLNVRSKSTTVSSSPTSKTSLLNGTEKEEILDSLLPGEPETTAPPANGGVLNRDLEKQFGSTNREVSFTGSVDFSEVEDDDPKDVDLLAEATRRKKMEELRNRFLHAAAEGAVPIKKRKGPRRGEDFTLLQALVKADFWLLFGALVCGSGTGLTAIDNMGQMSQAQGYSNSSVFVSMISIWNFLGRLIGGYASEVIARDHALPRPWAMAAAQGLMAVGHFLFAMAWPGSLYLGTLFVGIGYGSHWGIVPPIVSELFGMKHFGVLYNFYIMASPAGSLFFSGFLAGYLYDLEAGKQQTTDAIMAPRSLTFLRNDSSGACSGAVCFRLTFLIMTGVCILGISLTTVLSLRTQAVYKMLYEKAKQEGGRSKAGSSGGDH